jgi:DNA polymerase-3 subunit epsilon
MPLPFSKITMKAVALFKNNAVQIPASDLHFVVLDTETTGFNLDKDRILSIGALKLFKGRLKVKEALEIYVLQEHFDKNSVPIHGLLRESKNPQISEKSALEALKSYIGTSVIVGHHIRFDMEMLKRAFIRHKIEPIHNLCVDTGILYRKTLLKTPLLRKKEHYSLDDLAKRFSLDCKDRHTALGDAYLTALAFQHILEVLSSKGQVNLKKLKEWGQVN